MKGCFTTENTETKGRERDGEVYTLNDNIII